MQVNQVNFSEVAFAAFAATKGVKTSSAVYNGAPVEFLLSNDEYFACPFGASAYMAPEATRLNLELDVTNSPVLSCLQQAEQAIIKRLTQTVYLSALLRMRLKHLNRPSCSPKSIQLTVSARS